VRLPTHTRMRHPVTGLPLQAIGITRAGKPIWPVMGGSQPVGGEPGVTPPAPARSAPHPVVPTSITINAGGAPVVPAAGGANPPAQGQPPATGTDPANPGFPANTPLVEMTEAQQLAYWRTQARRHEDRNKAMADYDQIKEQADQYQALLATTQTEHEKAVADARRQGASEATTAANSKLVKAYVMAAVAGRLDQERVNTLLDGIDPGKFITGNDVDADKVSTFVAAFVPAAPATPPAAPGQQQQPVTPAPATGAAPAGQQNTNVPAGVPTRDLGQGTHTGAPIDYLEAGRAEARKRHPQPSTVAAH
jgi:hypothetical protein